MPITANVVAVVAILAGIVGIWLTNRNQRTLVRDQYQRDHVTKTYLMLLEAVHVRELQVNDADQLPLGQPSSVTPPADVASYEANFRAMLLAFSSPAIFDKLWPAFDTRTIQLIDLMNRLRQRNQSGVPG